MFRRGNPFVRAREETSSTHRASHLRAGLSLSWPSHVHIQPNLLKSCYRMSSLALITKVVESRTITCPLHTNRSGEKLVEPVHCNPRVVSGVCKVHKSPPWSPKKVSILLFYCALTTYDQKK